VLWSPGDLLTISAVGAEVPSFQLKVVAPAQPVVTNPEVLLMQDLEHARKDDFTITWTGGTARTSAIVWLYSVPVPGASSYTVLQCAFDATSGMATIASSLLEKIDPQRMYLNLFGGSAQWLVTGPWGIYVELLSDSLAPSGQPFGDVVRLQ
jgi:hypothetical protein